MSTEEQSKENASTFPTIESDTAGDSGSSPKYAVISGAKLAYHTYGTGMPLLMCVGFATNMDMWSTRALEMLQQKYQVIIFDYRGMGLSTGAQDALTIESMSEDLNELLDALQIKSAHVLGWSMGGCVAQMLALNHPEKVQKLILYATNCGGSLTVEPAPEIVSILSNPSATPMEMLSTLFTDQWLTANPRPWQVLPEASEPYNPATIGLQYMAMQRWLSPDNGSADRLHELEIPTLVLCGDQDKVVPSENSRILHQAIHTSDLVMVADNGHGLMYQQPETFVEHILAFLDK